MMASSQSRRDLSPEMQARVASHQASFRLQANFARGYSPLVAAMLDCLVSWYSEPEAAGERLEDAKSLDIFLRRLFAYLEGGPPESAGRGWSNELEATLRLGACVHASVLREQEAAASLRPFFASVGGSQVPDGPAFEKALFEFVVAAGSDLFVQAGRWRAQTNETSRGIAWLLPVSVLGLEAAHLVEIGAGAGLNLYADQRRWELSWEDGKVLSLGAAERDQFRIGVKGSMPEGLELAEPPEVISRGGGDRSPVDLTDPEAEVVLTSCIWGDQAIRIERLREGLRVDREIREEGGEVAKISSLELPEGLRSFLPMSIPAEPEAPVVLYNTCVTTYLSDVEHRAVERMVHEVAAAFNRRFGLPWIWIRFEPPRVGEPRAPHPGWCRWRMEIWERARVRRVELGWAHPHLIRIEFASGLASLMRLAQRA